MPQASQPIDARISSSRPGYCRIDNEIIKFESLLFNDAETERLTEWNPLTGDPETYGPFPRTAVLGGVTRGAFGTGASVHYSYSTAVEYGATAGEVSPIGLVYDYTAAARICAELLARFSNGIDIIRVPTGFDQYAVQVGDLVGIVEPSYLSFGIDGLTAANKWEVIAKSPDAFGGKITWTLAYASVGAPTQVHRPKRFTRGGADFEDFMRHLVNDQGPAKQVRDGLGLVPDVGRVIIVNEGSAAGGAATATTKGDTSITISPNVTAAVAKDLVTGAIVVRESPSANAPIAREVTTTPLGVAVADASTATTSTVGVVSQPTTVRNTLSVDGGTYLKNNKFSQVSRQ